MTGKHNVGTTFVFVAKLYPRGSCATRTIAQYIRNMQGPPLEPTGNNPEPLDRWPVGRTLRIEASVGLHSACLDPALDSDTLVLGPLPADESPHSAAAPSARGGAIKISNLGVSHSPPHASPSLPAPLSSASPPPAYSPSSTEACCCAHAPHRAAFGYFTALFSMTNVVCDEMCVLLVSYGHTNSSSLRKFH